MCDTVGVARKIDVQKVSAELADFIKELERDVHGEHVEVHVGQVEKLKAGLEKLIAPKA